MKNKPAAAAKSLPSCPTLCDPMHCSLPGSSIYGMFRQQYWNGVPLPFPIAPTVALKPGHSSELSEKWFKVQIIQPCLTALEFMLLPVGLGIYILINFYKGIWCSQSHDWYLGTTILYCMGFPGSSVVKCLPANAGNMSLIPGLGSSPRVGNGNPLQWFCLRNLMDRRAWSATVLGITKSQTWLSACAHTHTHTHTHTYR